MNITSVESRLDTISSRGSTFVNTARMPWTSPAATVYSSKVRIPLAGGFTRIVPRFTIMSWSHASSFADDDCPDPPRRFDVVREIVAAFFVFRESEDDTADVSVQRGDCDPDVGDITGSGADCDTADTDSHDPDDLRDDSRSESLNPDPSTGLRVRRAWSIVVVRESLSDSFIAPATAAAAVTVIRASKAPPDLGLSPESMIFSLRLNTFVLRLFSSFLRIAAPCTAFTSFVASCRAFSACTDGFASW